MPGAGAQEPGPGSQGPRAEGRRAGEGPVGLRRAEPGQGSRFAWITRGSPRAEAVRFPVPGWRSGDKKMP